MSSIIVRRTGSQLPKFLTRYYMGVYIDGDCRVFQVADDIDYLSCALLAKPGPFTGDYATVSQMIESSTELARLHRCSQLEINCSRGKGSYRWLRVP